MRIFAGTDILEENAYLSALEETEQQFLYFSCHEQTLTSAMRQLYYFFQEDNQRIYKINKVSQIVDLFALKETAIYVNCNVEVMDAEILKALEEDLIFHYKKQLGQANYQRMCSAMWEIFIYDPQIFSSLSAKAGDQIRIMHNNVGELNWHIRHKFVSYLHNSGGMAAAARAFFSNYTSLLLPIMHRSAADEVLILYCLKSLSREWGCDCPGINWKVKKLVEGNALEANKSFFNETDYTMLLRMEGIIREEF